MSEENTNCEDCKIKDLCPKHHEKCAISGYEADYQSIISSFKEKIESLESVLKATRKAVSALINDVWQLHLNGRMNNSSLIFKRYEKIGKILEDETADGKTKKEPAEKEDLRCECCGSIMDNNRHIYCKKCYKEIKLHIEMAKEYKLIAEFIQDLCTVTEPNAEYEVIDKLIPKWQERLEADNKK